jgi:hypothetical protein
MTTNEAVKKLKSMLPAAPKINVRNGRVEVEDSSGRKEEASEIQKHEFKVA